MALSLRLEADIEEIKEDWANGTYQDMVENAKAIGLVQASDSIADWISDILQIEVEDDIDDKTSRV